MNLDKLQKRLLAAARKHPPSDRVPYAFEQRIMARITTASRPDEWIVWVRALWYGAAVCAAVTLLVGAWSLMTGPVNASDGGLNFSQDLEQTIFASDDGGDSSW